MGLATCFLVEGFGFSGYGVCALGLCRTMLPPFCRGALGLGFGLYAGLHWPAEVFSRPIARMLPKSFANHETVSE